MNVSRESHVFWSAAQKWKAWLRRRKCFSVGLDGCGPKCDGAQHKTPCQVACGWQEKHGTGSWLIESDITCADGFIFTFSSKFEFWGSAEVLGLAPCMLFTPNICSVGWRARWRLFLILNCWWFITAAWIACTRRGFYSFFPKTAWAHRWLIIVGSD